MPALNFQKKFVEAIESGRKRQTIRAWKRPFKMGDTLYLYTGMMHKHCRKLGEYPVKAVHDITINYWPVGPEEHELYVTLDDENDLSWKEIDELAKADGFSNGDDMQDWLEKNGSLPFKGQLVKW